ncbi:MAG: flagellar basal body rod protein FlgB [Desulfobacterales bacterium]|nr:flagellar basal body rod protein FlgB [Desulfobacterales bacterium]
MEDSIMSGNRAFKVLKESLNISAKRHSLITTNVANVDTVGYKPRDIDFRKALNVAMDNEPGSLAHTHDRHYKVGNTFAMEGSIRKDAAGKDTKVDIDQEMTNLVENNIRFQTSSEMMLRKIALVKHAITEGGR